MKKNSFSVKTVALLSVLALTAVMSLGCFLSDDDDDTTVATDTTAPTMKSINHASNSSFVNTESVIVVFSESMNTTVTLGGLMKTEDNAQYTWSKTTYDNDTLTISPGGSNWSTGSGRTLTINGEDTSNNELSQIDLTYTITLF